MLSEVDAKMLGLENQVIKFKSKFVTFFSDQQNSELLNIWFGAILSRISTEFQQHALACKASKVCCHKSARPEIEGDRVEGENFKNGHGSAHNGHSMS